jgi:nicotinate dehydrogenase subunit A
MCSVRLTVNGVTHEVDAEPNTSLLYVLRNDLKLKGARYGCGIGECGACGVLMDDVRIFSCDMPLWAIEGKSIVTIEGLSDGGTLHPLQKAFVDEQAAQCGYCIDGIIIAAKALLDKNPNPSRAQICEALDGNLCRCGSHTRIIRAVQRAAAAMNGGAA